jgi:hypothetical protein
VLRGGGWGESLLLAQSVLLVLLLPAFAPPDSPPLRAPRPLPPLRGTGGRSGPGRRRIRSRGVHRHPLLNGTIKVAPVRCKILRGGGRSLIAGPSGSMIND